MSATMQAACKICGLQPCQTPEFCEGCRGADAQAWRKDAADQNGNRGSCGNDKAPTGEFTMDPERGLIVEVVRGAGKNIRTETIWLAAPFEIHGRARDPNSESWARLLRWRDDDGRLHEHR